MEHANIAALTEEVRQRSAFVQELRLSTERVIVGQRHMMDRLLIGLLTRGHILLEGLPGLAKTLAIKTLSASVGAAFNRIQFTPDLLPADIIGTMIYNPALNDFTVRQGPIFANFVLADEINRAPAKVQSALLEAMQERQVTIGGTTYRLEEPFLVLATQNPIEQEGTYPLPEAQTDRFMLKVLIDYPTLEEEREIMRRNLSENGMPRVQPTVAPDTILEARRTVRSIYMDEKIERYILDLVFATRQPDQYGLGDLKYLLNFGGSPRATINLALAAKAHAFLEQRAYVVPEDVRALSLDVLRHRIGITYEAEAENISREDLIQRVLQTVQVP